MAEPTERAAADSWTYVVTDIEADGPRPGVNSMLSFASVAVTADGTELGRFDAVLEPLPGAVVDPSTRAWFDTVPEAWLAATTDPRSPQTVMIEFESWVRSLPSPRIFAAAPLAFDGGWIDHYLTRFTSAALVQGPYETDRLFDGPGLCLRSYAAAITGLPVGEVSAVALPAAWLGQVEHTHRTSDDALGYAHLLVALLSRRGSVPTD